MSVELYAWPISIPPVQRCITSLSQDGNTIGIVCFPVKTPCPLVLFDSEHLTEERHRLVKVRLLGRRSRSKYLGVWVKILPDDTFQLQELCNGIRVAVSVFSGNHIPADHISFMYTEPCSGRTVVVSGSRVHVKTLPGCEDSPLFITKTVDGHTVSYRNTTAEFPEVVLHLGGTAELMMVDVDPRWFEEAKD